MIHEIGLFLFGLGLLVFGADRAVRAAANLGLYLGVSGFFIGVTVISIGTSVPEMATSIMAGYYGAGDLVVGNIVGSEISQITLAIGIVAFVHPIAAKRRQVATYGGAMILAMIIMILVLEDGALIRSEGVLMMLAYVFFIYHMYTAEGGEEIAEEVEQPREEQLPRATIPWILGGLAMVVGGGYLMVTNGIALARVFGLPQYLIGLLTGLGTTLPEVAVAVMAAREGVGGISVGSLLGSNITDPVFSLGIGGLVTDIVVSDPAAVLASAGYMLGVSLLVLVWMFWQEGIDRRAGAVAIALYIPSLFIL